MKPEYHIVSFSGGKDSTAMLLRGLEIGMRIDEVVYCDTTMEFPAMEEHVKKIKNIVETNGITFTTLKSEKHFRYYLLEYQPKRRQKTIEKIGGNPKGFSWAGTRTRWCTNKLKTEVIRKYKRDLSNKYEIIEYVGLAYDEQYRLAREINKNKNKRYPLVDWKWTESDALKYCYEHGFDWDGLYKIFSRVSCWCCPLQSLHDLKGLWKNFPDLWSELLELDEQTWRRFRPDYSVAQLTARFELEEQFGGEGKSINPHNKEFRAALRNTLNNLK